MANALKKITIAAKKIYKRGGTWKTAIKKAGVQYRAGKLGKVRHSGKKRAKVGARRKTKSRAAAIRKVRHLHAAEGNALKSLGSIASHIGNAKKVIEQQIAAAEVRHFKAKTKTAKRKIAKHIAKLKTKYRKLC
jgi:hypothetical protein